MSCEHFKGHDCSECDQRKKISVKEKNKTYEKINKKQQGICVVKIDGCFISDENEKKCDYLVLECVDRRAFFVELKGIDLLQAIKQAHSTIDKLKNKLNDFQINARVVLSKVRSPKVTRNNPKILKLERKLKKLNRGDLKYQSQILSE